MAIDFPSSPSTGDEHVASNGALYEYDGSSWGVKKGLDGNTFLYRTIYTRGYMSGGYKSGTPWRNCNRMEHATETTTNLGDIWGVAASYKAGGFSDYYHYMWGMTNSHNGTSSYVGAMSMTTEVERTNNTVWHLKASRKDADAMMNHSLTLAYICGGGNATPDKHNMSTEVMYALGTAPAGFTAGGTNSGVGIIFGQTKGWMSVGSGASFTFATEVWGSNGELSWGTLGQPKGLSSKHGFGYGSTGSYSGSTTYGKYNDSTGGAAVASISRPERAGEENMNIGQNNGYQLGAYNGSVQHNKATRLNYLTDTCTALGSAAEPKGHEGSSSGGCASASAQLLGVI